MRWETPSYVEIKMDAELSSYVDDLTIPAVHDGARPLAAGRDVDAGTQM